MYVYIYIYIYVQTNVLIAFRARNPAKNCSPAPPPNCAPPTSTSCLQGPVEIIYRLWTRFNFLKQYAPFGATIIKKKKKNELFKDINTSLIVLNSFYDNQSK